MVRIVVLDSAKAYFFDILAIYKRLHTPAKVSEFKKAVHDRFVEMKLFPEAGVPVPEAQDLGLTIRGV